RETAALGCADDIDNPNLRQMRAAELLPDFQAVVLAVRPKLPHEAFGFATRLGRAFHTRGLELLLPFAFDVPHVTPLGTRGGSYLITLAADGFVVEPQLHGFVAVANLGAQLQNHA